MTCKVIFFLTMTEEVEKPDAPNFPSTQKLDMNLLNDIALGLQKGVQEKIKSLAPLTKVPRNPNFRYSNLVNWCVQESLPINHSQRLFNYRSSSSSSKPSKYIRSTLNTSRNDDVIQDLRSELKKAEKEIKDYNEFIGN